MVALGGTIGYNVKNALDQGWGPVGAADQTIQAFTGFSFVYPEKGFQPEWLMRGLVPVIISVFAHKALDYAGVNKMFQGLPGPLKRLSL